MLQHMKQIGIREFNTNISRYLKEAPIQIKKRNIIVATILPGEKKEPTNVATSTNVPLLKKKPLERTTGAKSKICPHGVLLGVGNCRKGCK